MWEWCRFFFKRLKIQIFLWRVNWKKKVQPKSWELYFIWQKLGGLKSRRQVPQINLGELLLGGKGRSRFIKKFCNKEQVVWMLKDCCKLKKTKYQVNEFRAFFFLYEKMQECGITEFFPFVCTSALWGQYPVFSHSEFPQDSTWGSSCSLIAARGQVFFSFLSSLGAHQITFHGGCNCWWLWPSFVYCCGWKCSISQKSHNFP